MATALVSGALANKPGNGGNAWSRISWIRGLRRLGFDTWFVEQIDDRLAQAGGAYLHEVMLEFGLGDHYSLLRTDGAVARGASLKEMLDVAGRAELLLNIGGHLRLEPLKRAPRVRIYLDDDPGYTQIWQAMGSDAAGIEDHDFYYTFGANLGKPGCALPTNGIAWRATRPPVVLEDWPVRAQTNGGGFTTVASWRGAYGSVEFAGRRYDQKAHQFRRFVEMPTRTAANFEIALDIHPAETPDLQLLREHGWRLVDPVRVARTPSAFRRYVQRSAAEFSAAQGMYVTSANGWFSDRTTRYLASGKPVLVQETGFAGQLPTGEGLLVFENLDQAVHGVVEITANYKRHCAAARALAEEFFDSDMVIGSLLRDVSIAACGRIAAIPEFASPSRPQAHGAVFGSGPTPFDGSVTDARNTTPAGVSPPSMSV